MRKGKVSISVVVFSVFTIFIVGLGLYYLVLALDSGRYNKCGIEVNNAIYGGEGFIGQLSHEKPADYVFKKAVVAGDCVGSIVLTNNWLTARKKIKDSGDLECDRMKPSHIIISYDFPLRYDITAENPKCIGVPYKFDFQSHSGDTLVLEGPGKGEKIFCLKFKKVTDDKGITTIVMLSPINSDDVVPFVTECV